MLNLHLSYDLAAPEEIKASVYKKNLYVRVHRDFIHNNQDLETIQMLISKWENKRTMVNPY